MNGRRSSAHQDTQSRGAGGQTGGSDRLKPDVRQPFDETIVSAGRNPPYRLQQDQVGLDQRGQVHDQIVARL